MPKIKTPDGVNLYYEEAGAGTPVVFVHEFAGDYRTWEPQMRRFSRAYRCVTYSQRGYPPSDIPDNPARYGQDVARADVIALQASATLHLGDRSRLRLGLAARSGGARRDAGAGRRKLENVHGK